MQKKTLIIGASSDPSRYAYIATHRLLNHGHPVVLLGIKKDTVAGIEILTGQPPLEGIDTITLYIGPPKQPQYYNYLISLKPKRIIFNPGTENEEFEKLLQQNGIEPVIACTLVMLATGEY